MDAFGPVTAPIGHCMQSSCESAYLEAQPSAHHPQCGSPVLPAAARFNQSQRLTTGEYQSYVRRVMYMQ